MSRWREEGSITDDVPRGNHYRPRVVPPSLLALSGTLVSRVVLLCCPGVVVVVLPGCSSPRVAVSDTRSSHDGPPVASGSSPALGGYVLSSRDPGSDPLVHRPWTPGE